MAIITAARKKHTHISHIRNTEITQLANVIKSNITKYKYCPRNDVCTLLSERLEDGRVWKEERRKKTAEYAEYVRVPFDLLGAIFAGCLLTE